MQIFKAYFKLLRAYKGQMIMYMSIFIGILGGMIMPMRAKQNTNEYVASKADFAVFDYDNSLASQELTEIISNNNELIEIKNDKKETIQDELYMRNIDCVLRIKQGFNEAIEEKKSTSDYIEVVTIPGTNVSRVFESQINTCMDTVIAYMKSGSSIDESFDKAKDIMELDVNVSLNDGTSGTLSERYYYFSYLGWVVIGITIMGICPVLMIFKKEEIKKRIECSAYHYSLLSKELLASVVVTGIGLEFVICTMAAILLKGKIFDKGFALDIATLTAYMMVALSITYLVSRFVKKVESLNIFSNLIGLGMAFLCGIFVPRQFLGQTVIKIAHFLPAYWYNITIEKIDNTNGECVRLAMENCGVLLLFATVIITIALVIEQKTMVKA